MENLSLIAALLYHCVDVYPVKLSKFFNKTRGYPDIPFEEWYKINEATHKQREDFILKGDFVPLVKEMCSTMSKKSQNLKQFLLDGNDEQFANQLEQYYGGEPFPVVKKPQFGLI